uniref:C-type lectin domain-containing protein n=1 Tax=Hymenolepis diminuta TaxID=6216 RepID=A0A0R3SU39_HYMDI
LDFPCADLTWHYNSSSGKCYKLLSDKPSYSPDEARDACNEVISAYPKVKVQIAEVHNADQLEALMAVLISYNVKDRILLNARREDSSKPFVWLSDKTVANLNFMSWSGGTGQGDCLVMFYTTNRVQNTWTNVAVIEEYSCSSSFSLICEHNVKGCTNPPGGFDPTTMDFAPTPPHAGTITHVVCQPGFTPKASPQTSVMGPNVDPNLAPGLYKCKGKRNSTEAEDPSLYSVKFIYSGANLNTCETIRCDEAELFNMLPAHASLAAARSKLTEEEFGSNQVSEFSRYGNIVTYRCIESYFFADLSFEKYVECALKDGGGNVGEWKGYTNTILPLPQTCIPVTCQYEHVLLKESYNIEPNFTIEYPNGTVSTLDKLEPIPYPYQTRIHYVCKKGYETVVKKPDQNITCGPIGRWLPQLAGCISNRILNYCISIPEIDEHMITSSSGRYVPPLVEAPSAKEIGFVIIAFIVTFFTCPLLLDLTTVKRDIACFLRNIRLQKRLWQATRRLRKAKQAAREEKEDGHQTRSSLDPHYVNFIILQICNLVFSAYPDTFPCANSSWTYEPASGKCYMLLSETAKYNFSEAQQQCKVALNKYPNVLVRIAEIRNENELQALKNILVSKSLQERVYLNAHRQSVSESFIWNSDRTVVQIDFVFWTEGIGGGDCLVASYKSERLQNEWTTVPVIDEADCLGKFAVICEHNIAPCEDSSKFDSSKMEFTPSKPYVGTTTTITCKPGFYPIGQSSSTPVQFKCAGHRADPNEADPSQYTAEFQPINFPSIQCEAIRCSKDEMISMVPKHGILAAARSTLTEEEFDSSQQNMFNQFGNVVTVRCKDAYFYSDRALEKFIYCGLKANGSTRGEWREYSGTTLPLPQECEPVTCQYEDILLKAHYNIELYFTVAFQNSTFMNITKLRAIPYPYQTTITYNCKEGYETIRKTQDQAIVCGSIGKWEPQLTGCLRENLEDSFPCANSSWIYKPINGKCYIVIYEKLTFKESDDRCKHIIPLADVKYHPHLSEIRDENDLQIFKSILIQKSHKERVYINANAKRGEEFKWLSDNALVQIDLLPGVEKSTNDGGAILAHYTTEHEKNQWKTVIAFERSSGDEPCTVICEHSVKPCQNPPDFNPTTMEFKPTKAYVGTTTVVGCKSGFYPKNSFETSQVKFKCIGKRVPLDEENSFAYTPYFNPIPNFPRLECKKVTCDFLTEAYYLMNGDTLNLLNRSRYEYGEKVTLECGTGFVYALDTKLKKATMQCVSGTEGSSQGIWHPAPCSACIPIRCSEKEMTSMVPKRASLAGARSTLTEEEFGLSQQNVFNQFGNVVTIRCHHAFYFPDRSIEKFITCGLKSNSEIEGEWRGYGGTSLPLPKECEPVECSYEGAFLKAQYNIETEFKIEFENGTSLNLTRLKAMPYPYKTIITYTCREGYETVTKTQEQILICGNVGKWIPQLTACLSKLTGDVIRFPLS